MKTTVETTDLYLEELGQLFKDYEAVKNARITVANIQGIVELEAACKLKIVGYLKMYPFPESEAHRRIEELEGALKKIVNSNDSQLSSMSHGGWVAVKSLLKQD